MKRLSLTDISGGINKAAEPQRIPDNACTEMLNYEYRDSMYPRKRMGTDDHILNRIARTSTRAVAVWYSRYRPLNCTDDKMYVMVCGTELILAYLSDSSSSAIDKPDVEDDKSEGGTIVQQVIFSDIYATGDIHIFPTYRRLLVSDGHNPGRYIAINKDGKVESGELGIPAPKTIPQVSRDEDENAYSEVDTMDIGMGIERGSILQYCYTIEDKYGAESTPSPIATVTDMMFKYPDAESITTYKYYWYKATIRNLSIEGYTSSIKDQFKYFNLYRRAIDHKEGVIGTQFQLYRKVLITPQVSSATDSANTSLQDISYDKLTAPASSAMIDVNGIVFLSGMKASNSLFPFIFDKYVEISLNNLNSIDYVNPVVAVRLSTLDCEITGWETYLANPERIRLFFSDMTTPVPLLYRKTGNVLECYIKPPHLEGNRPTTLYLCFANAGEGVTDSAWNSFEYGLFCNYETAWSDQQVFDINRPLSPKHLICTNVPIDYDLITDKTFLYNLSNMDDGKGLISGSGTHTEAASAQQYRLTPYGELASLTGKQAYSLPFDGKNVTYTLSRAPLLPITIKLMGEFYAMGYGSSYKIISDIITCGDFRFYAVYLASQGRIYIRARIAGAGTSIETISTWMHLCSFPYSDQYPFQMRATIHLTKAKLDFTAFIQNVGYHASHDITQEFSLATTFVLFKDNGTHATYPTDQRNLIASLDLIESVSYNDAELSRMSYQYLYGLTFFREPIGAVLTEAGLRNDFANANITLTPKEIVNETNRNQVMWSEIGGNGFSALNFISYKEPVLGMVEAPSFLKMQYQNTIVVMTRNTVNRIPLTADLRQLGEGAGNVIPEFTSNGLYAPRSLVSGAGSLFWLSEAGVMAWSSDGLVNITKGVLDLPLHDNYLGVWVDRYSQYLLHDQTSRISYVYHAIQGAWTKFMGLNIDSYGKVDMGETTGNLLLLLYNNSFAVYPSTAPASSTFRITTKQIYIENHRPVRYRVAYDNMHPFQVATAYTYNEYYGDISDGRSNPPRMKWIMTPNGFWGEYVQISLDGGDGLTRIDIDIKEEL